MTGWAACLRLKWLLLGVLAASLGACAPSPPLRPTPLPPVLTPAPARPASSAASAAASSAAKTPQPAITSPVSSGPASWTPAPLSSSPDLNVSAAVEARFPEPAVSYHTPAFESGHPGFTTNAELRTLMRGLVRDGRPAATTASLLLVGSSQAGQPIEALLFTRGPDLEPAAIVRAGRPTVLLVGQQHGDEPAGAEALIVLAQALAGGRLEPLLDRINVIVLPRANPDAVNDMRRTTASGIDLNRDHLLLRTPEAQAQAQLARDYRPLVFVDAHEHPAVGLYLAKFGALPAADVLVQYAMTPNLPEFITKASEEWFRAPLAASLKAQGLRNGWYHTLSDDPGDKTVSMGGIQPDIARNANGLRNAVSFLIDTRGIGIGKHQLKRRVQAQLTAMESILQSANERAADLAKLHAYVDNEVSAHACQGDAVLEASPTPSEYVLPLLDPTTGADKEVTVAWDSALELRSLKRRVRPCGYWLSSEQSDAVLRLRGLGVAVQQIDEMGVMRAESYREAASQTAARAPASAGSLAEGGTKLRYDVDTTAALLDVKPGSYYVPLDQPLANLVLAALEPDTTYSFLAHGIILGLADSARVVARPTMKMSLLP